MRSLRVLGAVTVAGASLLVSAIGGTWPTRAEVPGQAPAPGSGDQPKSREREKGQEEPKPAVDPDDVRVETDLPELLAEHNRSRAQIREGDDPTLAPLTVDPKLTEAARLHALDMAVHRTMSHEGSDGSKPFERVARAGYKYQGTGENLAMGQPDAETVVSDWMTSVKHRANILGDFNQVGMARATGPDGVPYWAVVFGRPWPELEPSRAAAGLVEAINRRRTEAGKRKLRIHPLLGAAAARHARDCAELGRLEPTDSDGKAPLDRVAESGRYLQLGQSNATGYATAEEVAASWLKEETHRKQLLDNTFNNAGAGYATDARGQPYWTLILGRSRR
jgi:uncharacterized protein YkwD